MFIVINHKNCNFYQKKGIWKKTDSRKITVLWQFAEIKLIIKYNYSVKRQWQGKGSGRGTLHNHRNAALIQILNFAN